MHTRHVSRLSLSRQLLLLQMCIVVLVVGVVAAALVGLVNGFRMRRLPDIEPAANLEGTDFG